jgi:membrane protein YdbS with pleckstrin-like domain
MEFKLFPSFFDQPKRLFFAEQEPDENIELFLRQHGITNLGWIISAIFAILVAPFLVWIDQGLVDFIPDVPINIAIGAFIIYYLLVTVFVLEKFLFWYFNIYIVTNRHIVDVNFTSLLSRDITEVDLVNIESVSSRVAGILGPLFNFGDVEVETAAKTQAVNFSKVPQPDKVADRIEDLKSILKGGAA